MSNNKKKFRRTIGKLRYNQQYDFYSGFINGAKVTMNKVTDREGNEGWMINEEIELFEVQVKDKKDSGTDDLPF